MKLFFVKEQSLYTIFKTIEKVPNNKTVHIFIDPEHAFFDNERRAKQIKEIIDKKNIAAIFIAKSDRIKNFYENIGCKVHYQEKHRFLKAIHIAYLFLFNIKKFHLHALEKKNYIFYVVFGCEFLFIIGVLYSLYVLILPGATLYITPTYQIDKITYNFRYYPINNTDYPRYSRYLSVPFYSGQLEYKYELAISAANIKYIQNPSEGEIRIYNPSEETYELVKNTRFITEDGRLFVAKNYFTVPAGTGNMPGEAIIKIQAAEYDEQGNIMGAKGNIEKDTKLYIRNLKRSFFTKEIYAEAIDNFTGGSSASTGFVTSGDFAILSGKLVEFVLKNKNNIVSENFKVPDSILLMFDDLITGKVTQVVVDTKINPKQPIVKGYAIASMQFHYIKWSDMESLIQTYTQQRPSEKVDLISIDKNSLTFFNEIKKVDDVYIIPTQINIIQGYNFQTDINGVSSSIKSRIVGLDKDEARDIIVSYPEVSTVRIGIRPPWYTTIPKLKSRINIKVTQAE